MIPQYQICRKMKTKANRRTALLSSHKDAVAKELLIGTGTSITVSPFQAGRLRALGIWFDDLGKKEGPVAEIRPHGLLSHRVTLSFGNYSQGVINQIAKATEDTLKLARTLVRCAAKSSKLNVIGQSLDDWTVHDGNFKIVAYCRFKEAEAATEEAAIDTCHNVVIPLMAAMTELIGHNPIDSPLNTEEPDFEGERILSVFERRERSPRNRLACLRIHGNACIGCGLTPESVYGTSAGAIIEVHHLEPLSLIEEPRLYDPATDLIPLCPNCHRAVHTEKPRPMTLEKLRDCLEKAVG